MDLEFKGPAHILIAGNGAGKTTVLNSLYWTVSQNFAKLRSISFERICVHLTSGQKIEFTRSDLPDFKGLSLPEEFMQAEISRAQLENFLNDHWQSGSDSDDFREHSVVSSLYTETDLTYQGITNLLNRVYESSTTGTDSLRNAKEMLSKAFQGLDIIHLPTYRRVEESLLGPRKAKHGNPFAPHKPLFEKSRRERNAINYGLNDVISRLDEIADEIDSLSSLEYRNASATIIDDALNNDAFNREALQESLPDFPSLEQFLLRVSRVERRQVRPRPWEAPVHKEVSESGALRIAAIKALYADGEILKQQPPFLAYFLSKLKPVIETTKVTASKLQRFVDACNNYLEDSTEGKSFVYEPNSSKVSVLSSDTGQAVPMDHLSSGEKQIISLLAELYLYDGNKILLIDEPELSLSIEWQRRIIPDIINSGSVRQTIAITHSPFIFDNELDPYAGPLMIRRRSMEK